MSVFANVPFPSGLAFDSNGNLYAADNFASEINKITPGGVVSHFATLPFNSNVLGLAFDNNGNLYAADNNTSQISEISPDGLTVSTFATGVSLPRFIALNPTPEPGSAMLALAGGLSLLARRRRASA